MRKTICAVFLGLTLVAWSIFAVVAQENATTATKAKDSSHEVQEAMIRTSVAKFVQAYNSHDAKALAELFLSEAQVIDEDENTIQGRTEIEGLFKGIFEETPESKIEVEIESIRFIGTALALETGSTTTTPADGAPAERSRYSVLHVQRGAIRINKTL